MATRNIVPRANNEGGIGTTSKKWSNIWATLVNALTLTAQSVGFTISGGTTSKTLTVEDTSIVNQDLTTDANVTFASVSGSVTVGSGKTLDVSGGTLTLANDQISGDKIHGGTISAFASTGIDDNAAATAITIDSGGKVGIGTTSPTEKLTLAGSGSTQGVGVEKVFTMFQPQSSNWPSLATFSIGHYYGGASASTRLDLGLKNINDGTLTPDNAAVMTWLANGNVGIGTTGPSAKFHVLGTSGTVNTTGDTLAIDGIIMGPSYAFNTAVNPVNFSIQANTALAANVGGTLGLGGRYTGTQYANWAIIKGAKENATDGNYASYLAFGTRADGANITEKMRINSSGNVGIGTTSTASKLGVAGAVVIGSTYASLAGPTNGLAVEGNVGLGNTSPTAKLHVSSNIIRLDTAKTPASASATGNQGDICWDSSYIYVCTAANTWKRAALSTW